MSMAATTPVMRGVRMLVAPVTGTPLVFDPAAQGRFDPATPPAGWFDVGNVLGLERETLMEFTEVWSGAPAVVKTRARAKMSATLSCSFAGWSRLALALSSGYRCMNLLRVASTAAPAGSGGTAEPGIPLLGGSTATVLRLSAGAAVQGGDLVVVDNDYTGQTGTVGAGIPGAYVASANAIGNAPDYVRRVSFNVARVQSAVSSGSALVVTLAAPLPAGMPSAAMKLAVVQGFVDRAGGSYVSEWSALLLMDGVQGDRVLLHYPRLQSNGAEPERRSELVRGLPSGLQQLQLQAQWRALPVTDPNDGEAVLCYRSYLPALGRLP